MQKDSEVIVSKQRTVQTYAELWHASNCVLETGLANKAGCSYQFLSSALLSAFSLEAYLNHVGAKTFDQWDEHDRLSPVDKLELVAAHLGVIFPNGKGGRPLQTITKLFKFRNTIAHGRTQELSPEPVRLTTRNYQKAYDAELMADWERLIQTSQFATRVLEDVKCVIGRIHEARQDEKEEIFSFGPAANSATLASCL